MGSLGMQACIAGETRKSLFTSYQQNRLKSFREFVVEKKSDKDAAMRYRHYGNGEAIYIRWIKL